jgi:predicted AAA+ superfamily ATPase
MPNDVLPDLFRSYVQTYVERDVRQVADVSDQQLFTRFLALCAAITGQEVNHSQLGRELGVTPQTAARWLATLTATYQWTEIPPYHGNTIKRISKRPKGYFVDTGLAAWLQRISSPEALAGHPLQGALFETHVTQDILRSAQLLQTPPRAHHWRSHAGAEVDLVLERDGQFVPVEIKSKTRVTAGDARGIRAFRETYPALRQGTAAIVAAVERVSSLGEDITVIPYDLA